MMSQLQDPTHVVPSIIVGLLLSSGWEIRHNLDGEPYIANDRWPNSTYSTWWHCLTDLIDLTSTPENFNGN